MTKLATALSIFALGAIATTAPVSAAQRIDTRSMTASQVKQVLQEQGSAILKTAPNIYDRYVANSSYCEVGTHAKTAWVPTANSESAIVGYTCENNTYHNR